MDFAIVALYFSWSCIGLGWENDGIGGERGDFS